MITMPDTTDVEAARDVASEELKLFPCSCYLRHNLEASTGDVIMFDVISEVGAKLGVVSVTMQKHMIARVEAREGE